uniref:Predicted protein n=1 Tax=Hordeum vulgare subsp. vulgare TaxID=112509 RepID=F2DIN8_HORVV|nr:predicted protein [Hordeum vulgare subsp. vulgare]
MSATGPGHHPFMSSGTVLPVDLKFILVLLLGPFPVLVHWPSISSRRGYRALVFFSSGRQERSKRKSLRQIKRKRLGSRLKLLQMDLRKVTRNKGKMLRRLKILRISSIQTPLMGRRNHRQFEWPSSIAKV